MMERQLFFYFIVGSSALTVLTLMLLTSLFVVVPLMRWRNVARYRAVLTLKKLITRRTIK